MRGPPGVRAGAAERELRPEMVERRVWKQDRTGNISNLTLRTERLPQLAAGELRVAVKAVGLNFADVFTCLGLYAAAPKTDVIPGLEFAGVVEAVGPPNPDAREAGGGAGGQQQLRVGDRVCGAARFGAFADRLHIGAEYVQPIPPDWTFPQGAAFLVQGLTAMYGLRAQGGLEAGHTVLVHSAAGGCGQWALQICRALGATPIATVGSAAKVAFLRQRFPWLPERQVIVRDASCFGDQLAAALTAAGATEGLDLVLDAVSGEFFQPGFDALAPGGRYVIYGAANWTPTGDKPGWLRLALQYLRRPRVDPLQMIGQNRSVMGFNLIYLFARAPALRRWVAELQALQLPPPHVAATFAFGEAPAALRLLQAGQATGKVVLSLEDG